MRVSSLGVYKGEPRFLKLAIEPWAKKSLKGLYGGLIRG